MQVPTPYRRNNSGWQLKQKIKKKSAQINYGRNAIEEEQSSCPTVTDLNSYSLYFPLRTISRFMLTIHKIYMELGTTQIEWCEWP